jgi:predicted ferric reductase
MELKLTAAVFLLTSTISILAKALGSSSAMPFIAMIFVVIAMIAVYKTWKIQEELVKVCEVFCIHDCCTSQV